MIYTHIAKSHAIQGLQKKATFKHSYIKGMNNNNSTEKKAEATSLLACDKVYCVKCRTYVTRDERQHICNFECISPKGCNKETSQLVPSYRKVYTVYQYDRLKYGQIYRKLQKTAIKLNDASIFYRVSPYKILDLCYIRDEDGSPKNVWFEDKAHRRLALDRVMQEIAKLILLKYNNNPTEADLRDLFITSGVAVYIRKEYIQAEIYDLIEAPIKDRIHNHFLLLRYLRCGCEVKDAMRYVAISMNKEKDYKPSNYIEKVDEVIFLDKPTDEVGIQAPAKTYVTMNQLRGDIRLLDFFREMTEKHTIFYRKEIKEDFCKTFGTSGSFFENRFEDILEEVTELASLVGLKIICDRRLLYLAFEPYPKERMDMYISDKKGGYL